MYVTTYMYYHCMYHVCIVDFQEFYDRELYGKYAPAEISLSSHEMFPDFENDSIEMSNQDIQGQIRHHPT